MMESQEPQVGWKTYQKSLKRAKKQRSFSGSMPWLIILFGGFFILFMGILYTGSWIYAHLEHQGDPPHEKKGKEDKSRSEMLTKKDLPGLIREMDLNLHPDAESYRFTKNGKKLAVEVSLDPDLQNYILDLLKSSQTHQAAIVVMRPDNGQILAMANYQQMQANGNHANLCIKAEYPAASLFKVVSAAAAIEAKGFTPEKTLGYSGNKYTLYRRQLRREKEGPHTAQISFKEAFSGSINPVFGKIGIYDLGQKLMTEYAERFLFNKEIPFDLPLEMSPIQVPEEDFGMAEIASGFNKKTLISPLHAALITSAVANDGVMMQPWLVRSVKEDAGDVLYQVTPSALAIPIKKESAQVMKCLMADTVINGTSRKSFSYLWRKKKFSDIELGAKTGTINDALDQYKVDWIAAYALPKNGEAGITIAVLAVHGDMLGVRSREIARYVISHYFSSKKKG
jgi:penicillin-binding protein A